MSSNSNIMLFEVGDEHFFKYIYNDSFYLFILKNNLIIFNYILRDLINVYKKLKWKILVYYLLYDIHDCKCEFVGYVTLYTNNKYYR